MWSVRATTRSLIWSATRTSSSAFFLKPASFSSSSAPPPPPPPPPSFGQPHPSTHPLTFTAHNEVTPGITTAEYSSRRERLAHSAARSHREMRARRDKFRPAGNASRVPRAHLVIIPAASRAYMIEKIPYFFRQDTDFRYLTGCLEQDCVLALSFQDSDCGDGARLIESILFFRDQNEREERWEGPRSRPAPKTLEFFGVDDAYHVHQLESYLCDFEKRNAGDFVLWYDFQGGGATNAATNSVLQSFIQSRPLEDKAQMESPKRLLHELRLIKSPAEVSLMRQSAAIAAEAISRTMAATPSSRTEGQLFATVDYHCRMGGAQHLAYPPVVASGDNANVIHYIANSQHLRQGDLVLMDAGCELHGYTSDISRTWPVSGRFSEPQRLIYEIVLDVQQRLLSKMGELGGRLSVDGLYNAMQVFLGERLQAEGLLRENLSATDLLGMASHFCPHHCSHFLGMDVHDTALIPRSTTLQPGMVITIEPGVYIGREERFMPPEFRGIGVRIEDDVLITDNGQPEVLSSGVSKEPDHVERIVRNGSWSPRI